MLGENYISNKTDSLFSRRSFFIYVGSYNREIELGRIFKAQAKQF